MLVRAIDCMVGLSPFPNPQMVTSYFDEAGIWFQLSSAACLETLLVG